MSTLTIKVGIMPGQIKEVVVEAGTSIKDILAIAELNASGYTVRYNGTDASLDTTVNADGTVLLVKQIKGNANVKVGVMPGQIKEYAVNDGTTVAEVLALAELPTSGYTIRYNGTDATLDTAINADGTVLLVKQIKGNGNFKVGIMPGQIKEYAVEDGATVGQLLQLAEINANGYTIRVNGTDSTVDTTLAGDGTVLLVKQIKGNK